jgi:hypothetical protein
MYQLVLQFPTSSVDFDELVAIEDELLATLGPKVDGHDFGSGGGNIFIVTDNPTQTFQTVLPILEDLSCDRDATVAYRTIDGEEYTVIWPSGFKGKFSIA